MTERIELELEVGETCYTVEVMADVTKFGDEYEVGEYTLGFPDADETELAMLEVQFFAQKDTAEIDELLIESYEG